MHFEAVGLCKQLATSLTLVRKDPCVFGGVCLQATVVNKRCFTVFTLVRSLTSVPSSVFPQGAYHDGWKQLVKQCACSLTALLGKNYTSGKEERGPWERGCMHPRTPWPVFYARYGTFTKIFHDEPQKTLHVLRFQSKNSNSLR